MKFTDAFPGNWLKSEDLGDEDHVVTIEEVVTEVVGQGEQAKPKLVIKFKEFDKRLVCNVTNARQIAKIHGDETDNWEGKKITLWVNPDVQFAGETVSAIRVRHKPVAMPTAASAANGVLNYQQAVALCIKNGISENAMKDFLKSKGLTAYNPKLATPLVRQFVAVAPLSDDTDPDTIPF